MDGRPKCKSLFNKKRPVFNSAKARIENNTRLNKDEKNRALIANKKVTWALALKGGATIARGKDDDIKCGKWRIGSKKLRDAIRAISAIRRTTSKRKANTRGKRARSSMCVP